MTSIGKYTRVGRQILGPGSDLVDLEDDGGQLHTAIVFHPEFRDHPAINSALSVILGFVESPMVAGIVELVAHDREEGAFVHHRFIEQKTQEATAELMRTTRARIKVLEASLRARFLDLFRTHGYFVECAPKPRWTRKDKLAAG